MIVINIKEDANLGFDFLEEQQGKMKLQKNINYGNRKSENRRNMRPMWRAGHGKTTLWKRRIEGCFRDGRSSR